MSEDDVIVDENQIKEELNHPNFKKWFKGLLHVTEIDLEFRKVNGEMRKMRCTLNEDAIPQDKRSTGNGTRKSPEHSIAVYDLDKQDWRSFRYDSIVSFDWSLAEGEDYPPAPEAVIIEEQASE